MCDAENVGGRDHQLAVNTALAFAFEMLDRVSKEIEAAKTELLNVYRAEAGRDYKERKRPGSQT